MTLLALHFITRSSWPNSIGCSEWKRIFSSSKVKDDIPHVGNNFQTEVIIGAMEGDILLDNRTRWTPEGTGEIMKTWLES
jgi:hypothetical protein